MDLEFLQSFMNDLEIVNAVFNHYSTKMNYGDLSERDFTICIQLGLLEENEN